MLYQAEIGWYVNSFGMAPNGTWYGRINGERQTLKGEAAINAYKQAKRNPIYQEGDR